MLLRLGWLYLSIGVGLLLVLLLLLVVDDLRFMTMFGDFC
jgi:hypothetical protein